jgi:hypothetical protein
MGVKSSVREGLGVPVVLAVEGRTGTDSEAYQVLLLARPESQLIWLVLAVSAPCFSLLASSHPPLPLTKHKGGLEPFPHLGLSTPLCCC